MSLLKFSALLFFGFISLASEAKATAESCRYHYFANLHFSQVSFSKNVSRVYAHVGSLTQLSSSRDLGWTDVQHIELKPGKYGFQGKTEIVGGTVSNRFYNLGAVIQYWVFFEDGTQLISDDVLVENNEIYDLSGTSLNFDKILEIQRMRSSESTVYATNAVTIFKCYEN